MKNDNTTQITLVIFTIISDSLHVLLSDKVLPTEPLTPPFSLDEVVKKVFKRSTGVAIENQYTEQLYTLSKESSINIVYYVLLPKTDLKNNNTWKSYKETSENTSEYEIISYAVQRLQWKIEYTNVVYSLLPEEFTLSELQKVYEAILGKQLDKRNFRKKILSLQFLIPTEKKKIGNARPAQVYQFIKREPTIIHVFS